jgi:hypothetical protein
MKRYHLLLFMSVCAGFFVGADLQAKPDRNPIIRVEVPDVAF